VPEKAMALGVPCTIKEDRVPAFANQFAVAIYVENAKRYKKDLRRLD
jgi:hypothetical protein